LLEASNHTRPNLLGIEIKHAFQVSATPSSAAGICFSCFWSFELGARVAAVLIGAFDPGLPEHTLDQTKLCGASGEPMGSPNGFVS
jgi:hypothetical protein